MAQRTARGRQNPQNANRTTPPPSSPVPPNNSDSFWESTKNFAGILFGAIGISACLVQVLSFFGITSWQQLWENPGLIIGTVLVILALDCIFLIVRKNTSKTNRRIAQIGVGLIVFGGLVTAFIVFKPTDPKHVKIVVARFYNFDQREDTLNNVTNEVIRNLNNALHPFSDVELESLRKAITEEDGGSEAAQKEGKTRQADIVIWGSYEGKNLNVHFDVMTSTAKLKNMPALGKEAQGETQPLPAEMKSVTLTLKLAQEMTYLSLFTVGMARYSADDWDGAIVRFTAALSQTAEDVPALSKGVVYFYRGLAYSAKGNYDLAIQDYNKALELDPNDVKAYNNRGFVHGRQCNYDLAIQDYNKALELDPKSAVVYTNHGIAYSYKGDYDRAIQDYNKALELDPKDAVAYNNRGIAYSDKGNYDLAIQDYNKALELDPKLAAAYTNRGLAYERKGNADLAIQDYTKALELDPKLAIAYYNRGVVYSMQGNSDLAIKDYTKALELDP